MLANKKKSHIFVMVWLLLGYDVLTACPLVYLLYINNI